MIDIHCHVIPLVDDGAKSFEESLNMGRKAQEIGITAMIATPHYIEGSTTISSEAIRESVKILNEEFKKHQIDVTIYPGNEIFFSNDMFEILENKKAFSLNQTKYVLFEFPMYHEEIPRNAFHEIENLQISGYYPILAHPERYLFTKKHMNILEEMIHNGVLMQLDLGSVLGIYGKMAKRNAKKLLKKNMIHLIATDSHNASRLYPQYALAYQKLQRMISKEKLDEILEKNSKKILKGKKLQPYIIKKDIFDKLKIK